MKLGVGAQAALGTTESQDSQHNLVDVSDSFFWSARGRGKGESEAPGRGAGVRFFHWKSQEGGGGLQETGEGPRGWRVSAGSSGGGGGQFFFFRGESPTKTSSINPLAGSLLSGV